MDSCQRGWRPGFCLGEDWRDSQRKHMPCTPVTLCTFIPSPASCLANRNSTKYLSPSPSLESKPSPRKHRTLNHVPQEGTRRMANPNFKQWPRKDLRNSLFDFADASLLSSFSASVGSWHSPKGSAFGASVCSTAV